MIFINMASVLDLSSAYKKRLYCFYGIVISNLLFYILLFGCIKLQAIITIRTDINDANSTWKSSYFNVLKNYSIKFYKFKNMKCSCTL